jgi:hypothetical protein
MKMKGTHKKIQLRTLFGRIDVRPIFLIVVSIFFLATKPADFIEELEQKYEAFKSSIRL